MDVRRSRTQWSGVFDAGVSQGALEGLLADGPGGVEGVQGLVHQDVPQVPGGLDGVCDLGGLALPDEVPDGPVGLHHLAGQHPAPAHLGQKLLAENGF